MKFNRGNLKIILIFYLIVSLNIIQTLETQESLERKKKITLKRSGSKLKKFTMKKYELPGWVGSSAKDVAASCLKGLTQSLEPVFCWKKSEDIGLMWPLTCASGYTRSFGVCIKDCDEGYEFKFGLCTQKCPNGWSDVLSFFCKKDGNVLKWSYRSTYLPDYSLGECEPGYVSSMFGVCYKDCGWKNGEQTEMLNCGPLACVNDKAACTENIIGMVADTFIGLASLATFVVSFGTAGPANVTAKVAAKQAVEGIGIKGLKIAGKKLLQKFQGEAFTKLKKKAWKYVKEKATDAAINAGTQAFCNTVWDETSRNYIKNTDETNDYTSNLISTAANAVDVINFQGISSECSDGLNNGKCYQAIVSGLANFDPTGVLTIAAAYIKPICDLLVPTRERTASEERIGKIKPGCILVYSECGFTGNEKELCETSPHLESWGDQISSIVVGLGAFPTFFIDPEFKNKFFTIGQLSEIDCLKNFHIEGMSMNNQISSIHLGLKSCVIVQWDDNDDGVWDATRIFCESDPNFSKSLVFTDVIKIQILDPTLRVILYNDPGFRGAKHVIDHSVTYDDNKQNPERSVGFYTIKSLEIVKKSKKKRRTHK